MYDGGFFMLVILLVFFLGICIALERALKYLKYDINSSSFMNEIQKLVLANKTKEAIQYCSGSKALLPRVIKNGLKRANQDTAQVQNAIDASALEIIPMVEQRLGYLNLFANISTLLGLLGTIFGLMDAFAGLEGVDPSQRAALLSAGISKAMNTTAFGLISAICIMVAHAKLNAKSEKIISEVDQYAVKLLDILGTMKIVNK